VLQIVRVRSFDGHAESSAPNLAGRDSEGTSDTEQDGVVIVLGEAVVHQEGSRSTVYVGEGVLDLTSGTEDFGNNFVVGLDELN